MIRPLSSRSPLCGACLALILTCGACRLAQSAVDAPGKLAAAAMGKGEEARPDPWTITQWMMGFADAASRNIEGATEEFAALAGTDEARIQALEWRIEYVSLALQLATASQPYDGLFGSLLLLRVLRADGEAHRARWGEATKPLEDALERLDQMAWAYAGGILSEPEVAEIRGLIDAWHQANPDAHATTLPQFRQIADKQAPGESSGGLSHLLGLDPLAGLEPAARSVELARQLAERMLFFVARAPRLVEAQVELLSLRLAHMPEVRSVLDDSQRFSTAATSLAATAETLPRTVGEELTAQRAGLVADLDAAREPAVEILDAARSTLEAARETSLALAEATRALDAFVGRFQDAGEPVPAAEPAPGEAPPPGKPFDIADYGLAAEKIGVAARELTAAITALDGSLPALERTLGAAVADAQATVDLGYRRALQLLLVALAGALAVWTIGAWISGRRAKLAR